MKEIKINFNTEDGQAEFTTPVIDGKLDGLIISSNCEVSIIIQSSLGYSIFHNSRHKGIKYYAPRTVLQGPIKKLIVNDQFDNFILNESLSIIISGPKNQDVTVRLRID